MFSIKSDTYRVNLVHTLPLDTTGWSNRGWLEIIQLILLMCENGARKTHVMYRCNLNSKQINEYLNFLLECGMLEKIQERPNSKRYIYRTRELGIKFISSYNQLAELFSKPPPQSIS
jgi:predicted transcriptional regulator